MGRRTVTTSDTPRLLDTGRAPTIAEQVRRALQEQEERRCQALERAGGKRVKRRQIKTPSVRLGPKALCHRPEYFPWVREYDYDLSDPAFCEYARRRGILCVAGLPNSRRWQIFADHQTTKEA